MNIGTFGLAAALVLAAGLATSDVSAHAMPEAKMALPAADTVQGVARLTVVDHAGVEFRLDAALMNPAPVDAQGPSIRLHGIIMMNDGRLCTASMTLTTAELASLAKRRQIVGGSGLAFALMPARPETLVILGQRLDRSGIIEASLPNGEQQLVGAIEFIGPSDELRAALRGEGVADDEVAARMLLGVRALLTGESLAGDEAGAHAAEGPTFDECWNRARDTCKQNCASEEGMAADDRNCISQFDWSSGGSGSRCSFSCHSRAACCRDE